ncbi:hypothetical protein L2E82_28279 [Cichorium intybus]|uniref:Uncharacterized protein n=1 Tax=Cichorium intybus TaxID=13427 RepID=A0ACB9CVI3_CICIN|nr:hypothetical protein L2E82_28279 [Cichorium intybus]
MSANGGDAEKSVAHFNLSPTSALKIQKGDITRWFIDSSSDAIHKREIDLPSLKQNNNCQRKDKLMEA